MKRFLQTNFHAVGVDRSYPETRYALREGYDARKKTPCGFC